MKTKKKRKKNISQKVIYSPKYRENNYNKRGMKNTIPLLSMGRLPILQLGFTLYSDLKPTKAITRLNTNTIKIGDD